MNVRTIHEVPVPDGGLDGTVWKNAGESVFIANFAGRVGPSGRFVTHGDILTLAEAGNGESHGTVYRLPAGKGIVALVRAALARVDALEGLVVSGDPAEIEAEADQIRRARKVAGAVA